MKMHNVMYVISITCKHHVESSTKKNIRKKKKQKQIKMCKTN